jgi:hypothetical protein
MLSLNIKSSNYMCIDIDPDSVIHKQIVKKIDDLTFYAGGATDDNYVISTDHKTSRRLHSCHSLTMLDSFHISLGAPKKDKHIEVEKINDKFNTMDVVPVIGDITLAPIYISETENKKSAWVPLDFKRIIHPRIHMFNSTQLNLGDFGRYGPGLDLYKSDGTPFYRFHVSVANLTGKPRDSIARPEDCIIDTITA